MLNVQDETFNIMAAFDSRFLRYGETAIYEAEADIIDPGITVTEMANILWRTPSDCSRVAHKLRDKGWVEQKKNPKNNRIYNLTLTEKGLEACEEAQIGFRRQARERLCDLTETEQENHLQVKKMKNSAQKT